MKSGKPDLVRTADNGNGTFTNPVIFADYPDPDIIRVGADFYMVSSSFTDAPGIPICHSRDLVNWKVIGHAYERLPASNPAYGMAGGAVAYRGGSWAPSIRYRAGTFYICFNTPAEGFFMCVAARPQGPYEQTWFGGHELYDPGLFFDDDDRVYVVHGVNDIYLTELTPDALAVKGRAKFLYSTCFGVSLEGSHLYKRGGYYYVCNTGRGYNGIQVVYRSAELTGPYEGRLVCADDLNYSGAGLHQGGLIELENGDTWFCLFQDRDYVGRVPVLLPARWMDAWPVIGDPENFGRAPVTCGKPITGQHDPFMSTESGDGFDGPSPGLPWHWNHNPDDSRWSLTARPGWLRLQAGRAPDLPRARNTLTQKITGGGCVATTRLDTAALQPGDLAGICVLGFPHAFIAVEALENGRRLVMVNDGARIAETAAVDGAQFFLRADADADGVAQFSHSADDERYEKLGDNLIMQFSVKSFLGNKFGLFCFHPAGQRRTGHADFDWLRYECARGLANHFSAFETIPIASYDAEHRTDTHHLADKRPRQMLINVHDGDWVRFDHIDFGAGAVRFEVLASAGLEGGTIELHLDDPNGETIGECRLPASGERNLWLVPWQTFSCRVKTLPGVQRLYLRFAGGEGFLMRVQNFAFFPQQDG